MDRLMHAGIRTLWAAGLIATLLALVSGVGEAAGAAAGSQYSATLDDAVPSSLFDTGGVSWNCDGKICTGTAAAPGPIGAAACKALAARVGAPNSFEKNRKALRRRILDRCRRKAAPGPPSSSVEHSPSTSDRAKPVEELAPPTIGPGDVVWEGDAVQAWTQPVIEVALQDVDRGSFAPLSQDIVLLGRFFGEHLRRAVRIYSPQKSVPFHASVKSWSTGRIVIETPPELLRGDPQVRRRGLAGGYSVGLIDDAGHEISNRARVQGISGGEVAYDSREKDGDGDGVRSPAFGGDDCDDSDPDRFPGNAEVCDERGHDEDCNPLTFGDRDSDGDHYVDHRCWNEDPDGRIYRGDDCNDSQSSTHPHQVDPCDGIDNNCDGQVDEGVSFFMYRDSDCDSFGTPDDSRWGCRMESGHSTNDDDCDDGNRQVNPRAIERPDGIDNDCDGQVDE